MKKGTDFEWARAFFPDATHGLTINVLANKLANANAGS